MEDPGDRAIGGERNRRPLGGAAAHAGQDSAQGDPEDVGVVAEGAAETAATAGPSAGARRWQRKRAATRSKPSASGDVARVNDEVEVEEGGVESAASAAAAAVAKPWLKKRVPPTAATGVAASSDQIEDEIPTSGEQDATVATPWKSKTRSRGSVTPKPWQTKAGGGNAGDGGGNGVLLTEGPLGDAVVAVAEGSGKGQGQGGGGSVDELEIGMEHRDWKQRVAVFEVQ